MFVCECCVLAGRGLCDELIARPEESYRLWCVVVCDLENLKNKEAMTHVGSQCHRKKITRLMFLIFFLYLFFFVLYVCFLLCVFCVFHISCTFSQFLYSCFFPIFVYVYRPLPLD
jgi:hypothetical protein